MWWCFVGLPGDYQGVQNKECDNGLIKELLPLMPELLPFMPEFLFKCFSSNLANDIMSEIH